MTKTQALTIAKWCAVIALVIGVMLADDWREVVRVGAVAISFWVYGHFEAQP